MEPANTSTLLLNTLSTEGPDYGLKLSAASLDLLVRYYELLQAWNARLHLVAPCSPKEFATRHLLESLFLTKFIPPATSLVDIGSGAGLPIIPCLIVRRDVKATLIEASQKKSVFLREALKQTKVSGAAVVVAERFENVSGIAANYVTCRALDKFEIRLPDLIEWSPRPSTLLLFGGPSIQKKLQELQIDFREQSLPKADRRFLFIVGRL